MDPSKDAPIEAMESLRNLVPQWGAKKYPLSHVAAKRSFHVAKLLMEYVHKVI